MVESNVLEQTAEHRVENTVSTINISNGKVVYELENGHTDSLCSLRDCIDTVELPDEIRFPDHAISKLNRIQRCVSQALDSDVGGFPVDRRTDSDGDLVSLVVSFPAPVGDVVVRQLYDSEGRFDAHELKETLNGELVTLWTTDLYVDHPRRDASLYTKQESLSTVETIVAGVVVLGLIAGAGLTIGTPFGIVYGVAVMCLGILLLYYSLRVEGA